LQLKHTYLRVLHPLMTNTQLRHHPYKRPQLRKILETLIRPSLYREVDATTRRLVERNLRGSWCAGLKAQDDRDRLRETSGSTLSVDAVAVAEEGEGNLGKRMRRRAPSRPDKPSQTVLRRRRSLDDAPITSQSTGSTDYADSPMTQSVSGLERSDGALGMRMEEKQAVVDEVAQSSIEGTVPLAVKASYQAYLPQDQLEYQEEIYASSPVHEDFDSLPPSIPSIEAGHDLLDPVAQRHLTASNLHSSSSATSSRTIIPRSISASHPPLHAHDFESQPPLIHPRPRSASLSAHLTHPSKHYYLDEDAPPLPPSPLSNSSELPLNASARRRRPPPPPDANLSSANSSRPRTPVSASHSVGDLSDAPPGSPKQGRRRAPPPPSGSPRTGLSTGFEGLRVA